MNSERQQQIMQLLEAVQERAPHEHDAFLQQACAADSALRREVESLLAAEARAGSGFLKQPAMQDAAQLLAAQSTLLDNADPFVTPYVTTIPNAPPDSLNLGALLGGRYQIERELGRGGIGVVFLARDRNLHNRQVVIKALLQERLNGTARALFEKKFRDEIKALALIEDPAIVRPLDAGQLADGRSYLVMEYVAGQPLGQFIAPSGMDLPRVARLLRQIARALDAAHSQGVVHRDLTPNNILLLNAATDTEQIKLIDFGLATVREALTASHSPTTVVAGTPVYMAPEQLRGKPEKASDIYALGVLAYQLTTGSLPFAGKTFIDIEAAQRAGIQTLPCALRPNLPPAAQAAILRALSLDPRDRYASATAFSEDFQRALSEVGNDAYQTSAGELSETVSNTTNVLPPSQAWRWWLSGGLLAVLLLGALAWRSLSPAVEDKPASAPVVSPVSAERTLSYALLAQKNPRSHRNSQPFAPLPDTTFGAGDLMRLTLSSAQSGYLYLLSEARESASQSSEFVALFPNHKDNGSSAYLKAQQVVQLPPDDHWWDFSAEPAEEKLWLIWAEQRVLELEGNRKDVQALDARASETVRRWLAAQRVIELKLARDESQPPLQLAGKSSVLVGWLTLPR